MRKRLNFLLAIALYAGAFYFIMTRASQRPLDFSTYGEYWRVLLSGWMTTIVISALSVGLALIIGLVLYAMAASRFHLLQHIAEIHKTIIYGTPLLVIVIVSYYYIGTAFGVNSKLAVGVLTLGLYIGAYVADIYKGAVASIHVNQWQAAKMFGFTKFQTYRYIIFPQVIMSVLPPLAGQFALTIKGSALLSYMATEEFMSAINSVMANSFRYPEGFILVTAGYLIITVPIIRIVRHMETKLNYRNTV